MQWRIALGSAFKDIHTGTSKLQVVGAAPIEQKRVLFIASPYITPSIVQNSFAMNYD